MESRVDPYRTVDRPKPAVVVHRPVPIWLGTLILCIPLLITVLTAHRVALTCDRDPEGGGSCVATDRHPAWSSAPVSVDVGAVRGARLLRGQKGATVVALVTTGGDVQLSGWRDSFWGDDKLAMIEAVQRFVVSRSEPHLEAAYGSRWFVGPFFLLLVVPAALMLWFVGRPVRVVVDRGSREVRIERSRFPLAPTVETWPIDEVTGATVEMTTRRNSNRPACRVALTLTGGVRVPLTSGYNSGAGVAERTAAQIQDALAAQG